MRAGSPRACPPAFVRSVRPSARLRALEACDQLDALREAAECLQSEFLEPNAHAAARGGAAGAVLATVVRLLSTARECVLGVARRVLEADVRRPPGARRGARPRQALGVARPWGGEAALLDELPGSTAASAPTHAHTERHFGAPRVRSGVALFPSLSLSPSSSALPSVAPGLAPARARLRQRGCRGPSGYVCQ